MTSGVPAIGLVGCGHWGRNLARNLDALGALRAICDADSTALEAARAAYPGVALVRDPEELFSDPRLDGCVIATQAETHAELARRALQAGKDVLVEKPLALSVPAGEALEQLARESGRVLMVGHVLEYHPAIEKLQELIRAGELGKIQYVYSTRLNLGRIRVAENALWSFAPHDVHVVLRLLGEMPVDVSCHGGSYLNRGVVDVTMSVMSFASGVRGHIFVSWLHPYKEQKLIVVGDRKMVVFDDSAPLDKLLLYPHRVEWVERVPIAVKAEAIVIPLPDAEPLARECEHFLRCIMTRARPRTDGASGVAVLRVLEACQRSLDRAGHPVGLATPSSDRHPLIHPTATVDPDCEIGEGTHIWHYSHVMSGAKIGRHCTLGQNVFIGRGVVVGDNVKIQNNVSVYEGVVLEDDVFCGPSMVFTNVANPRSHTPRRGQFVHTRVRLGATIGANATLVCGSVVGRHAFVGAGAVVTRDVPDYALVLGMPGRIVGWMCRCGERLALGLDDRTETGACATCGATYRRAGDRVETVVDVR